MNRCQIVSLRALVLALLAVSLAATTGCSVFTRSACDTTEAAAMGTADGGLRKVPRVPAVGVGCAVTAAEVEAAYYEGFGEGMDIRASRECGYDNGYRIGREQGLDNGRREEGFIGYCDAAVQAETRQGFETGWEDGARELIAELRAVHCGPSNAYARGWEAGTSGAPMELEVFRICVEHEQESSRAAYVEGHQAAIQSRPRQVTVAVHQVDANAGGRGTDCVRRIAGVPDVPAGCNGFGCWEYGGGCNGFGCWSNGGGCNGFGCWHSPQGSCNGFGCSDVGECTGFGCPSGQPETELVCR